MASPWTRAAEVCVRHLAEGNSCSAAMARARETVKRCSQHIRLRSGLR